MTDMTIKDLVDKLSDKLSDTLEEYNVHAARLQRYLGEEDINLDDVSLDELNLPIIGMKNKFKEMMPALGWIKKQQQNVEITGRGYTNFLKLIESINQKLNIVGKQLGDENGSNKKTD